MDVKHNYWEQHCCEGMPVQPSHGHKTTPVCSCGWQGAEQAAQLLAYVEWERHVTREEQSCPSCGAWQELRVPCCESKGAAG